MKQLKKEKNYYKRHLHLWRYTCGGRDVLLLEKHKEVRFNEKKWTKCDLTPQPQEYREEKLPSDTYFFYFTILLFIVLWTKYK